MNNLIQIAKSLAHQAHAGQFRRDHLTPYVLHPQLVVELLDGEPCETIAAAWLHDVVEDTRLTFEDLINFAIPESVVEIVKILTKSANTEYQTYLQDIKNHNIARKIKIADMIANLTDSPTEKQIRKYTKGILFLSQ